MYVILIRTDFQEFHLVTPLDAQARLLQRLVDLLIENDPAILRRKNQVIQQNRDIVALMDIFAHWSILRRKRRGIGPGGIKSEFRFPEAKIENAL